VFLQGFSALDSSNGTLGTAGVGLWFLP
jgi:hypothetical protein